MNKAFLVSFFLLAMILLTVCGCSNLSSEPQVGEMVDSWVTENSAFRIRINKHTEKNGGFVAGAYFIFQSASKEKEDWKEIMTIRHDDPIAIPRQQVRFLNEQTGYVFMGLKFATTMDEGKTWFVWYTIDNLPDWRLTRAIISDVQIESNGVGSMKLRSFTNQAAPSLNTEDFGKTWRIVR